MRKGQAEPFDVMDSPEDASLPTRGCRGFCVWEARKHQGAAVYRENDSLV